jgi:hypothetical protein
VGRPRAADAVAVTHEFLALLLGVRRQGVTVALHELEGKGLIRSTRGEVRILDREGLELAVTGFYGVPEAEYASSMGAGRGRNPDPIPAFVSTTPKFYRTF